MFLPVSKNTEAAVRKCSSEVVAQRCFVKKTVLRDFPKFTRKNLCQGIFITKVAGQGRQLYLKRDPVSWCFMLNLRKNTFSYGTTLVATSSSSR